MAAGSVLALAVAAGLSPWLALLMIAGLAAFTGRVPLAPVYAGLAGIGTVAALAVALGLQLVLQKLQPTARWMAAVDLVAALAAGGLLGLALRSPLADAGTLVAVAAGGVAALVGQIAVRATGRALSAPLQPFGGIAAGMAANVVAGAAVAAVFALNRGR